MHRKFLRALPFVVFALSASMCRAQVPSPARSYAISGSVHNDRNDEPIPEARVLLLGELGQVVHPVVLTNRNGEFALGQFRPGEYDIVAECDGYAQVRFRVDITRHDEISLAIRLRADPKAAAPEGNLISTRDLTISKKARDAFDRGLNEMSANGDYLQALEDFRRAAAVYPDYYEAYAQMGVAYVRIKNFGAAETALRKSITLSSNKYLPPLLLLAMVLNDSDRPSDAESAARQATLMDPQSWRGQYELARALLGVNRIREAEVTASAARDLKADSPDVYLLLGEIHRRTNNGRALLQDFDTYLRLAPEGQAAPKVRKLREQLVVFLQSQIKSEAKPETEP